MSEFAGEGRPLGPSAFDGVLRRLGIGAAELWAVIRVETAGVGFLPDRRPVILFERHWFSRLTDGRHDEAAPEISNRRPGGYGARGAHQYERLQRAIALDRRAALESTSWGLGQLMGFNARAAGFADVETMVAAMVESEDAQLEGMAAFIDGQGLAPFLARRDWAGFARRYNGPGFRRNRYDEKLAAAHARYAGGSLPSLEVRAAQLRLTYLGEDPHGIDGFAGPRTAAALRAFQERAGLPATGELDEVTARALEEAVRAGAVAVA